MAKGDRIRYRAGYKYQLVNDYQVQLKFIRPAYDIETEFIRLSRDGVLWLRHGYASDGPSGPTKDSPDSMRGAFVHDALYQLIRDGYLDLKEHRGQADREFLVILLEDNMHPTKAQLWYAAVRIAAEKSATPAGAHPMLEAP
jgi:hypothetical protein